MTILSFLCHTSTFCTFTFLLPEPNSCPLKFLVIILDASAKVETAAIFAVIWFGIFVTGFKLIFDETFDNSAPRILFSLKKIFSI
jgi:hypothetical protein